MADLSIGLSLRDAISGPANRAASSLNSVRAALQGATRTQGQPGGGLGSGLLSSLQGVLGGLSSKFSSLGGVEALGALVGPAGEAAGAIGTILGAATVAGGAVVALGVKGAMAFSQMTVGTGMFRENTLMSLEVLLRSKDAAEKVYNSAVKFASVTPFETKDVVEGYKQLLAKGFSVNELEPMFKTIGDFAAGMDNQNYVSEVTRILGQIRSLGKLTGGDLKEMVNRGVNRTEVIAELVKATGKDSAAVEKMLTGGDINADVGLKAITTVINKKFGGMMDKLSGALSGIWSTVVSRPFELVNKAFEVKDSGVQKFFDSIKGLSTSLGTGLSPDSNAGKKVIGVINSIGESLSTGVDKAKEFSDKFWKAMEGDTGKKFFQIFDALGGFLKKAFGNISTDDLVTGLDKVLTTVNQILPLILSFGEGFGSGFMDGIKGIMDGFGGDTDDPTKKAEAYRNLGEVIGKLAGEVLSASLAYAKFTADLAAIWAMVSTISGGGGGAIKNLLKIPTMVDELRQKIVAKLKPMVVGIGHEIRDSVIELGRSFTQGMRESLSLDGLDLDMGLGDVIFGSLDEAARGLEDLLSSPFDTMQTAIDGAVAKVKTLLDSFGKVGESIGKIPGMSDIMATVGIDIGKPEQNAEVPPIGPYAYVQARQTEQPTQVFAQAQQGNQTVTVPTTISVNGVGLGELGELIRNFVETYVTQKFEQLMP